MTSIQRRAALGLVAALAAGSALAQPGAPVRVGSKIDTEGKLLGNMIVLALEANGIRTVNKTSLGTTTVVRAALLAGEIDIYPEYTGNGSFIFSEPSSPVWKNAKTGYERVKTLDYEKNRIVWLEPAPANNTWAIAVRRDVASANKLKTLDDMARWINSGGSFKLAASAEFAERSDALPAFQKAYGFTLKPDQLLTLAGGDTAATIRAAAEKTSGVNAAMAYGTDGPLAALGLVIMQDTKAVQGIFAPAPLVREDALKKNPKIRDALAPVFKLLDGPTLQSLNAKIQLEGQDAKKVAGDFLKSNGLLK
ncbi:MAG: ABC transporter substrate-binding protein [Polaromonas sp. 39-63-203]|jgi:osmoprotectant transport system substrate-binding protein|uniref:glycine betaine ABC transporter substrate-binding protein OsmF n=1 Tax=Polaromonas sp. TaxID=1869339 RepID=UPI000BD4140E|nr:ABC transporter substrate-binding protein [Polaromonas sp.]OYY53830.1 MAG: ABC transporter substrate-binding protein [Polaromonas sp. 35-63-240]OYZ02783.1 MAG: ABC transporter substrate-binding protein [Polaromonas sp. 28-63-22]OYZ84876.1 MAG: ABC transporter substrate-binding protein [Polaromonas sp. 24-62-144]OZB02253.1 MAG: ABC transporter substrate-binding protein [Polaromonas sp. 39-63-203]HQS30495.1 ABC transporter substrate-binding protein [Polaromonas sp.]